MIDDEIKKCSIRVTKYLKLKEAGDCKTAGNMSLDKTNCPEEIEKMEEAEARKTVALS